MLKQSVFIFSSILFTLSVLLLLLLITVVAKQNDNNNVSIECPKQNVPIELLRALDMKKLPKKRFEILDEMRNEFTEILSTNFAAVPNNFVQSDVKKKLSIKVVIWHFKLIVEDSLDRIEQMEVNGNYWTANEAIKMGEEWANLLQNVNGKSMEQKICLLQAFTHRIIRNEISKTSDEWKIFVKNVARAIFSINVGSKFGYDTITTLSEEEYMEHAKKCDESEYSSNVTNKLLSLDSSYLIHRLCLHILIADSEEFQHFLCYHKNIAIYKQLFHLIMGTTELYVLEEIFPNILHIEKLSATRRLDGHFVQFHYRTGSECAIGQESRVTIRLLLGEPELIECEKAIRQKADRGTQFGRHMLDKLNAVKKAALAKDAVMSPKGICMVIKLRDFLGKHNTGVDLREEELKSVDEWWPHECDQPQEVEAVFRLQRLIANQKNRERQSYICFMALWRKLVTFPGRPTRLHKFLQLSEREIELECIYDYRYTDPKVFRSSEQLEILYTDALRTANTAHQKATKLAADIFCWVFWLEANVLELNEEQKNGKMPRFTMAWRQNRWYYEMVYDQLFDIEKADEEAELDKKRIEIDILLDKSTIFVHESLKMSDGKLKIELGTQKIKRLAQQNGTAPPPPGTLDREWYEIRRKSKAKQESVVREFEGLLQNIHFEIIKNLLSKCNKFNKEFGQRSLDALRVAAFVGSENVNEIHKIALKCCEQFDECFDVGNGHFHFSEKNWDEKEIINGQSENTEKPGPNIEEQTPFDVDAALDFVNSGDNKKKSKRKSIAKKVPKKNLHKNALKTDSNPISGQENSKTQAKKVEMKQIVDESPEISLSLRKQLVFDVEVESCIKTASNSLELTTQSNEQKCQSFCDDNGTSSVPKEKAFEREMAKIEEKNNNLKKKKPKNKNKKRHNIFEYVVNGSSEQTKSDETTGSEVVVDFLQKDLEIIGLFANEIGWTLFLRDEFLVQTYQKFFTNPTESMRQIVTIGCYINEIGHRMEVIDKLYAIGDQNALNAFKQLGIAPSKWIHKKLGQNWQKIKSDQMAILYPIKSDQQIAESSSQNLDKFDLKIFQKILWKHLKMIIKFFDTNSVDVKSSSIEGDQNPIIFIEKQIHLRKMALALFLEQKHLRENEAKPKNIHFGPNYFEYVWHNLSDQSREIISKSLLGPDFNLHSLSTYFNHFSLMVKQIEQDQKLRNELSNYLQNNFFTFAEIFGISLHLQEIKPFDEENFELIGDNSKSLDSLSAFLSKNGFGLISNDRKMKIDQSIKQIEQSAREWNYKAKILVTGSYVLGTLTKDSDIDVICIIPELLPAWGPQQFFGTAKCEFRRNGQRHCADKSLYCRLCLVLKVVKLNRIQDAWMPLIELKFEIDHNIFIDFDIGFAAFAPNEDIFQSNESINFQQSEALSRSLRTKFEELAYRRKEFFADAGGESYEKMMEMNLEEEKLKMKLRSLSGFEVGVKILNKLFATEHSQNDDNKIGILKTYRTLLLAVKMWAKNHHIYDNKLGFFNGISLSILAAKVMLLYPMASIPFLIEKFFFTFSTWPWPTPVKLTDLPDGSVLRWEPRDEGNKRHEIYGRLGLFADLTMPIVTPGLIEQNTIFNVNKSTATIIQREIQEAIKNIRNWPNLTISQDERWEHLLKDKNFDEKYSHFIRITCEATLLMDFDDFCGYVETRVRLQLLMDVERFDHIRLGHSKNVVEKGQFFEQSKGNKKEFFRKIWLVGLELADKIVLDDGSEVEKPVNSVEWIQRLNSMLSDQFGASIEKAYRMKKHLVGIGTLRPHIQLTCKYESR